MLSLFSMLDKINSNKEQIVNMAMRTTNITRVVSASAHVVPITQEIYDRDYMRPMMSATVIPREEVPFATGEIASLMMMPVVNNNFIPRLDIDDVLDGMRLAGYIHELNERYAYAVRVLNNNDPKYSFDQKHFTKRDRIEFAFGNLAKKYFAPPGFDKMLMMEFQTMWNYGHRLEVNVVLGKDYRILEQIEKMVSQATHKFGFVDSAIISPYNTKKVERHFQYIIPKTTIDSDDVEGVGLLVQHIEKFNLRQIIEGGSVFAKTVNDLLTKRRIIQIDLPFRVSFKKYFDDPDVRNDFPLEVFENSTAIKCKDLTMLYDLGPEYSYIDFHRPSMHHMPMCFGIISGDIGLTRCDVMDYILSRMKMVDRLTNNVRVHTVPELFTFSFYKQ